MVYWYRRLKKWVRPLSWSWSDWLWFFHFFFHLWFLFFLNKRSFQQLRSRLVRSMSASVGPVSEKAQPLFRAFQRVLRWTWVPRNCLREALLLQEALASQQIHTRLVIGVSLNDQLRAHAWLVGADGPLLQDAKQLADYVPFEGDFSQWMG